MKAMTNLESVLKSRDITLQKKFCRGEAMAFPVVMYKCASWTIKKAEHRRIDAFKLWCWRRLLRVPWTPRSSNPVNLNPEYSLEGVMLKLKLRHFGHLMRRAQFIGKDPDAGKDWGQEEKGATEDEKTGWHHRFSRHEFEQTPEDSEEQGNLACCSPRGHKELDTT